MRYQKAILAISCLMIASNCSPAAATDQAATASAGPKSPEGMSRSERHRQMAERRLRHLQSIWQAQVAGKIPDVVPESECKKMQNPKPLRLWMLGGLEWNLPGELDPDCKSEFGLKELQAYWHRIPDFGIKKWRVYPSETGWTQVTVWSGTGIDGKLKAANEVDVITTDKDFDTVSVEIIFDYGEWNAIWNYLDEGKESIPLKRYFERVAREPGLAAYKNKKQ